MIRPAITKPVLQYDQSVPGAKSCTVDFSAATYRSTQSSPASAVDENVTVDATGVSQQVASRDRFGGYRVGNCEVRQDVPDR